MSETANRGAEEAVEERLRADAVACLRAGIDAVEPERLVRRALERARPEAGGRVVLAAIGKAAGAMSRAALAELGERLELGIVVLPAGQEDEAPAGLEVYGGGHPVPSVRGVEGSAAVVELASGLGKDDLLLALVSGGGSALATLPAPGLSLGALQETTRLLLGAGATIGELNCVRKHLDALKGGRLAAAAAPARVLALVLSDVVGDPLDVIASGPLSPDPTTYAEALAVLERRGVLAAVPAEVRRRLERGAAGEEPETPKPGDACFERVEVEIVGNNILAARAALTEAKRRGYGARLLSTALVGEAREVGRDLAKVACELGRGELPAALPATLAESEQEGVARDRENDRERDASENDPPESLQGQSGAPRRVALPAALVAAGETTVTVRGAGRGGRNQELVLAAAIELDGARGVLVASAGTDGVDGPTDAAGALATGTTLARARALGLDAAAALADNDSYPFFESLGDLIVTGPTGTNVMDLQIVLAR